VEEIGCVRDGAIWDGRPGRSSTRISKNNRKIQTNHHFRSPGHTFLGCKTGVSRCHQSAVCFRTSRSTCLTGNPAIWQQIEEVGPQRIGGESHHITSHHIKQITQETTANQIFNLICERSVLGIHVDNCDDERGARVCFVRRQWRALRTPVPHGVTRERERVNER
jgi:hypothetical protein